MHPVLKEGNKVGECSTQSGEPRLQWTYWRDHCTVFHEDSCSDCEAWQDHYLDCTSEDSFERALNQFYDVHDQGLEQRLESLTLEIEKVDQETKALNRELEEVEAETARVQQGQQTTHVISQIWETLGQLQHDSEIEDAHSGASLAEPSSYRLRKRLCHRPQAAPSPICISGSDGEHGASLSKSGPSSRWPRKRPRHTTPPETTNPIIYISSDSDGEHIPTPAPTGIVR